jgi:hypothetical protein
MVATYRHITMKELLEVVFSVRSVPRLYNEGQLPLEESLETAMRRVGGRSQCSGVRWLVCE